MMYVWKISVLGLDGKIGNFEVLSDQLIDRMHKWRPISYSFVVMLIILTGLILMKNFCCIFFHAHDASEDD